MFVLFWVRRKDNVAIETLEGLLKVFGELFESSDELFLLFWLANLPICWLHLIHKWFVDVIDDCVECRYGMLRNLSEEHFTVILTRRVDWFTGCCAPQEVDTFTGQFFFLA